MRPTPALCVRLRFSTKDVGKGFYRGNRTGSMGAHTPKGGYLIDYRKVRHYNVPDLKGFNLTPYVTREIGEIESPDESSWEDSVDADNEAITAQDLTLARRTRAMAFLRTWRQMNRSQFDTWVYAQKAETEAMVKQFRHGEISLEALEKLISLEQEKRGLQ